MGRATGIEWTRSTRNFWSGCTKVGPGCDGCYAESFQRWIRGINIVTQQAKNWGPGAPREDHRTRAMRDVNRWNGRAGVEREYMRKGVPVPEKLLDGWKKPGFYPVFINSHSDTFDNDVPDEWRWDLWSTIKSCPNIDFQLVTKRIPNVAKMVPPSWMHDGFPRNVWIIITVVNQEELDRDFSKLMALPGVKVRGLSMEPMIGPIDVRDALCSANHGALKDTIWGIVGGESNQSGHPARPFNCDDATMIVDTFREFGQPVFVKQLGAYPLWGARRLELKDDAGGDMDEWPSPLRVREFPHAV